MRKKTIVEVLSPDREPSADELTLIKRVYKHMRRFPDVVMSGRVETMIKFIANRLIRDYRMDETEIPTSDADILLMEIRNTLFADNLSKDELEIYRRIYAEVKESGYITLQAYILDNRLIKEIEREDEDKEGYHTYYGRCKTASEKLTRLFEQYHQYLSERVPFEHGGEMPKETATLVRRLVGKYNNKDKGKGIDIFLKYMLRDTAEDYSTNHVDIFDMTEFLTDIKCVIDRTIKTPGHGEIIYKSIYEYSFDIFVKRIHSTFVEDKVKRFLLVDITRNYLTALLSHLKAEQEYISYLPTSIWREKTDDSKNFKS